MSDPVVASQHAQVYRVLHDLNMNSPIRLHGEGGGNISVKLHGSDDAILVQTVSEK